MTQKQALFENCRSNMDTVLENRSYKKYFYSVFWHKKSYSNHILCNRESDTKDIKLDLANLLYDNLNLC